MDSSLSFLSVNPMPPTLQEVEAAVARAHIYTQYNPEQLDEAHCKAISQNDDPTWDSFNNFHSCQL